MLINSAKICFTFLLLTLLALSVSAQGKSDYQKREFCSNNDNWSSNDRVSFHELRETKIPSSSLITVDGRTNGGVRVVGENRSDVLVRACVQTWGNSDSDARSNAKNVRIETGSTIHAEGPSERGDWKNGWSVSYEILVPRSTNLKLLANNGGISISNVDGNLDFETRNGGIHLDEVGGNVKGRTTNGGVHVVLSGNSWKGNGLDLETTNGGVDLQMPSNYAAHFETRTVNGGFRSEISGLNVQRSKKDDDDRYYRVRGVNISTDLNGGGAPIRVVTTNGGVRISSK